MQQKSGWNPSTTHERRLKRQREQQKEAGDGGKKLVVEVERGVEEAKGVEVEAGPRAPITLVASITPAPRTTASVNTKTPVATPTVTTPPVTTPPVAPPLVTAPPLASIPVTVPVLTPVTHAFVEQPLNRPPSPTLPRADTGSTALVHVEKHPEPPLPQRTSHPPSRKPWTELYRPQTWVEVVGNSKAKDEIRAWRAEFAKKPLLIAGPVGVGKTSLARALCNDCKWVCMDCQALPGELMPLVQQVLFRKPMPGEPQQALVLDEVDEWHGNERSELVKLLKSKKRNHMPIILLCEDAGKKIESLRGICKVVRLYRSGRDEDARTVIQRVLLKAKTTLPPWMIHRMAKASSGDFRKAVNITEMAVMKAAGSSLTDESDVFVDSLFDAAETILSKYPHSLTTVKCEEVFNQHDLMLPMLHENVYHRHESVLQLSELFSDMDLLDSHRAHQTHDYPGALSAVTFTAMPPPMLRIPKLQFPASMGVHSKKKSFASTLQSCNLSFDSYFLFAPLVTDPKVVSWLKEAVSPELTNALDSHGCLSRLFGQ